MTEYIDYDFYKSNGGNMSNSDFNNFIKKASAKINNATFGRIDIDNIPEEVKFCTCELLDKIKKYDSSIGKVGESVGKWSVTYKSNSSVDDIVEDTIKTYLANVYLEDGTPILFRGC